MNYNGSEIRRKESLYFVFGQDKEDVEEAHDYLSDLLGDERVGDIDWRDPFPSIDVLATQEEMFQISVKLGIDRVWA